MKYNKNYCLVVLSLVVNILFCHSVAASDNEQVIINDLLQLSTQHAITPNPYESIEPFSGTLALNHTDFSAPVAPGLNMEVKRSYRSDVYGHDRYRSDTKRRNNTLTLQSWSFHNGYISFPLANVCMEHGNACKAMYISGSGEHMVLLDDKYKEGHFNTVNHYKGYISNGQLFMFDTKGNKYTFGHHWFLYDSARFYLSKVETPNGDWVKYHYDGAVLGKITSSNPNQVIDIRLEDIPVKLSRHGEKIRVQSPTAVYYNGRKVASYKHSLIKTGHYKKFALKSVELENGKFWEYGYDYLDLNTRPNHFHSKYKDILTSVRDESGLTNYNYSPDYGMKLTPGMNSLRLSSITTTNSEGIENGKWNIGFKTENKDKVVTISNNYFTTVNRYNNYASGSIWKAGLLKSSVIYKDNAVSQDNILQSLEYDWQPVLHNNEPHRYLVYFPGEEKLSWKRALKMDSQTYRPVLAQETTKRGNDEYKTQYTSFDEYDNPGVVIQTTTNDGNKKQRIIHQEFINNVDANTNLIGLPAALSVNGKSIIKQDFDSAGNLIYSNNLGNIHSYKYSGGLLISDTDNLGNTTHYNNHKFGTPENISFADGSSVKQSVNDNGFITSKTNAKGNTSKFKYNDFGDVLEQARAVGNPKIYNYRDALNLTMQQGDYTQEISKTRYDLPILKKSGNDRAVIYRYDALGRKILETYPFSSSFDNKGGITYRYDSLNRLVQTCTGKLESTKSCVYYSYLSNNTTKIQNSNGEYKLITKHSFNNPDNGKVVKIQEFDRFTKIDRDSLGYVKSVSQGDANKSFIKEYKYDNNYNLTQFSEPETGVTSYKYDVLGNRIEKNNNNFITKYGYHPKNYMLLSKQYSDNSDSDKYKYDLNGNLISSSKGDIQNNYTYDANDQLISESLISPYSLKPLSVYYNYNLNGHMRSILYPDGKEINLSPDEYGSPSKIEGYIDSINYYPNGQPKNFVYANGVKYTAGLDSLNRVNNYNYGTLNLKYDYDSNNNLLDLNLSDSKAKDFNHHLNFNYDKSGRITNAKGPWGEVKYKYDLNDNIVHIQTSKNPLGAANSSKPEQQNFIYSNMRLTRANSTANGLNNVIGTYAYDSLGNISTDGLNKYNYGADGNLLSVSGRANSSYEYDAHNNRVVKSEQSLQGSKETISLYSKAGQVLYEFNPKDNTSVKYIYFNGHKVAKTESTAKSAGFTSYYYNDAVGSPVAMADSNGSTLWREVYSPFGATFINSDVSKKSNKHWFAGKELDSTDLSYFGARYYNSKTGRFMSPDPADVQPENPFSFNRYGYANNNPYKYVDPDGRWAVQAVGFGAGALSGLYFGWTSGKKGFDLFASGMVGGAVGVASTFGGSSIAATAMTGAVTNTSGDIALKAITGHSDEITVSSELQVAVFSSLGNLVSRQLGYWAVPNRNLPAANATSTNYIQQTIRQFAYNDSEVEDSVRRSIQSSVRSVIFEVGIDRVKSLAGSMYTNSFLHNQQSSNNISYTHEHE